MAGHQSWRAVPYGTKKCPLQWCKAQNGDRINKMEESENCGFWRYAHQNFEKSQKGIAPTAFTMRTALSSELIWGSDRKNRVHYELYHLDDTGL